MLVKIQRNLDEGIESALSYAETQIENMKKQFAALFDELDEIIQEKYSELEQCATDQQTKAEELKRNRTLLDWIEACKTEIDEILNI